MSDWKNYKRKAEERGSLALELYAVETSPVKGMEEVQANLKSHLLYQTSLEKAGKLAFAGPLSDETGELMQGVGLIVYRAASFDEARSLAECDPMHTSGARSFVLRRWLINEGSVSLSVGLSTHTVVMS